MTESVKSDSIKSAPSFRRHLAWTSESPLGLQVASAEGPFLNLEDGTKIIDLISGIAVSSLGHRHPAVLRAIEDQISKHLHVMVYGEMILEPQVRLASRLAGLLPSSLSVIYFTMTGTEANEGALKLARKKTGRTRLVAFDQSYHGDTMGSLSVTGRKVYRAPYEPLVPDVLFLPFDDIRALEEIDESVAAVIAEPIQGEGGIRVPSREWIVALRERCSVTGSLLIFDEIQTGFGRTGSLFAFEKLGVIPDILTLAKAMGGGMPIGAFISSAEIFATFRSNPPLSHVTTFGGHPVSCAAADAALVVLTGDRLAERAIEIEQRIRSTLKHPLIREIRGMGAMLGMELIGSDKTGSEQTASENTAAVVNRCLERGVLLGWTLHSDSLIRLAPPLNIPWPVLDQALGVILESLDGVASKPT